MCIQVVERYTICRCLYYKHAIDRCEDHSRRAHRVQTREVLVGYTCPEHSLSGVYRPSGTRPRRQAPPSDIIWAVIRSEPLVSVQTRGPLQHVTDRFDNGPAAGSAESILHSCLYARGLEDVDTDAPTRYSRLPSPRFQSADFGQQASVIPDLSGSHQGQSEVQAPSTSAACPGQFDTRHAPSPGENTCPHQTLHSAGACPRECC